MSRFRRLRQDCFASRDARNGLASLARGVTVEGSFGCTRTRPGDKQHILNSIRNISTLTPESVTLWHVLQTARGGPRPRLRLRWSCQTSTISTSASLSVGTTATPRLWRPPCQASSARPAVSPVQTLQTRRRDA